MTLPRPQSNHLPSTFIHAGWKIKYNLLAPSTSPGNNPPNDPPTLVFIHGTPWSSTVFQPLAHSLLATNPNQKILLYDLPGYGQSQVRISPTTTATPGPLNFQGDTSIKAQAKALAALLAHLSLDGKSKSKSNSKPPAILAHDIAGTIALRAHLLHGCAFARLMLLDTNAVLPWGDGFYQLVRASPDVFTRLPAHIHEAVVRAVVRSARCSATAAATATADEWEDAIASPWLGGAEAQESFVRQIAQAEDRNVREMVEGGMYGRVECEVVILWGQEDGWIPREKMERFVGLLGEDRVRRFVVVEDAGHLLMLDQPGRVEAEVREWLGL